MALGSRQKFDSPSTFVESKVHQQDTHLSRRESLPNQHLLVLLTLTQDRLHQVDEFSRFTIQ